MKRSYLYLMLVAAVVIIIAVLYFAMSGGGKTNNLASFDNQPVPQSLVLQLQIPANSSSIGAGVARITSRKVTGPSLNISGKPEVLYIGSEFCPYCALERWGLAIALSRFGNFTGLEYMTSSHLDIGPDTPTFTFINATYTSPYIAFVSRETAGNQLVNGSYPELQKLDSYQTAILNAFDSQGYIPFVDFANESVQVGANYDDLTILANRNWSAIASQLHNQSSVIAMAVVGSANIFTAQICKIDGNAPASVCGQAYIQNIESQLQ